MISVRSIKEEDLEMIMNWRMQPDVTRYMTTDPVLTLEGQKKWFQKISNSTTDKYWVVCLDNVPVGLYSLTDIDWDNKTTSSGFYIAVAEAKSMYLVLSLQISIRNYVFDTLKLEKMVANIFSDNKASLGVSKLCGNKVIKEVKNEVIKNGKSYDVTYTEITADDWHNMKKPSGYEEIDFDV